MIIYDGTHECRFFRERINGERKVTLLSGFFNKNVIQLLAGRRFVPYADVIIRGRYILTPFDCLTSYRNKYILWCQENILINDYNIKPCVCLNHNFSENRALFISFSNLDTALLFKLTWI